MRIIEIKALDNGAHRNQEGNIGTVPEGWAVIPEDMEIPDTFPFVIITAEDGVVKTMEAGEVPPSPDPPTPEKSTEERVSDLEDALAQTDDTLIELYELIGQ